MLDYLVGLASRLGNWGYGLVALGALLESAAFLGLLVPGESLVVVAGFLAHQGVFDVDVLIVVVFVGAVLGDNVGYELGRRLGHPWASAYGAKVGLTKARLDEAEAFFRRHGGKAVALGRFVGFARALVPFVAGSSGMHRGIFAGYNALGAAVWAPLVTLTGYFVGRAAERWVGHASAWVGGIVLVALILLWAGRWVARHETEVRHVRDRLLQRPWVAAVGRRLQSPMAWLRRRFSPVGYLGLQLTLGLVAFTGAAWLFGGVTEDVLHGDPLTRVDGRVAAWLTGHRDPAVTAVMTALSDLYRTRVVVGLSVLILAAMAWRRLGRWMAVVVVAIPCGLVLAWALQLAFVGVFPLAHGAPAKLHAPGFPDGPTMSALVLWGTLSAFLVSRTESWSRRTLYGTGAALMVLLVGMSRVYLVESYPSAVIAGVAAGIAWLSLVLTAFETYGRRRGQQEGCED